MAYDTDAIERDISNAKRALGRQLSEAEDKARRAVDWRAHYQRNPLPLLGAAAAAGLLASAIIGSERRRAAPSPTVQQSSVPYALLAIASANSAMERLADAFIAAASTKVAEYVEDWVPGFHKEFTRRQS